jgi:hypothetical protein
VRSPVVDLLADLGSAFDRLRARWYVFGAQAALLHGATRLTADVDVTVELLGHDLDALVASLRTAGFEPRVPDLAAFAARTQVVPMVHGASRMPVDLVVAGPGPEQTFLARVQRLVVEGVTIPVARAEDVVAMKLLAGRQKDFDDAAAILAAQGDAFDLDLARATLRALEQALDRSDLLPELQRALARARS